MSVLVTMLQTRRGEDGTLWTVAGSPYVASDGFAAELIGSNLARRHSSTTLSRQALENMRGRRNRRAMTRRQWGRGGTLDNTTGGAGTYHVTACMAAPFSAARWGAINNDTVKSYQVSASKMSVTTSLATEAGILNGAGTWVTTGRSALTVFPTKLAMGGSTQPYRETTTFCDFVPLQSQARTDGGDGYLLCARAYFNGATATLPCYGNGSDDFVGGDPAHPGNWATKLGHEWIARQYRGDGVTTPANFTGGSSLGDTTVNRSQSPIVCLQVLPSVWGLTIGQIGDSREEGRGDFLGESYIEIACRRVTLATGIPLQTVNLAYSGQSMVGTTGGILGYAARALDALNDADMPLDVLVYAVFCANDSPTTLTDSDIAAMEMATAEVVAEGARVGTTVLLTTGFSANAAQRPWGASDAKRTAYIARMQDQYADLIIDTAGPASGPLDGSGQVTLLGTDDDIHLSESGQNGAALQAAVERRITHFVTVGS